MAKENHEEVTGQVFKRIFAMTDTHTFNSFRMRAKNEGCTMDQALAKLVKMYTCGQVTLAKKDSHTRQASFSYLNEKRQS